MKRITIPIITAGFLILAACANPTIPESPSASPASAAPVPPPPPAPAGTFKPPYWLIGTWTTKNNSLSIQVTKDNIIRRIPPLGSTEDLSKKWATTKDTVMRVTESVRASAGSETSYTIKAEKRVFDRNDWRGNPQYRYQEVESLDMMAQSNGGFTIHSKRKGKHKRNTLVMAVKQGTIPIIAAGLLVLAACSMGGINNPPMTDGVNNPPTTSDRPAVHSFPSKELYQRVVLPLVRTGDKHRRPVHVVASALEDAGVRIPDRSQSESAYGAKKYTTTMFWFMPNDRHIEVFVSGDVLADFDFSRLGHRIPLHSITSTGHVVAGEAFPSFNQYRGVMTELHRQVLTEDIILKAFTSRGVRSPDSISTKKWYGVLDPGNHTSLTWKAKGHYDVTVVVYRGFASLFMSPFMGGKDGTRYDRSFLPALN